MITITVKPARLKRVQLWEAFRDGKWLCAHRDPFCGAARVLLAQGVAPETPLQMKHEGSKVVALRGTVGGAAALAVSEPDAGKGPRLVPYRPYANE